MIDNLYQHIKAATCRKSLEAEAAGVLQNGVLIKTPSQKHLGGDVIYAELIPHYVIVDEDRIILVETVISEGFPKNTSEANSKGIFIKDIVSSVLNPNNMLTLKSKENNLVTITTEN